MTLRVRLAAWTFVSALALAAAVTTLLAADAERARVEQVRAEGRRIALAAVTLYDVLRLTGSDADRATLQSFLAAAARGSTSDGSDALAWALVLDEDGARVAGEVRRAGLDDAAVVKLHERVPAGLVAIDAAIVARDSGAAGAPTGARAADAPAGRVLIGLPLGARSGAAAVVVSALASLAIAFAVAALLFVVVTRRVVRPLAAVAAGMEGVRAGRREQLAPLPGRSDEAAALIDGFNDMVTALAAGERNKSALERHVGKRSVDSLVRDAVGTGTKARVTALFFEVDGFAVRMGRDAPEDVVVLLQEIVSAVVTVVQEHGGHVEKLMGDALLAVWGMPDAPVRATEGAAGSHEERAVQAALAIVSRCKSLSDTRRLKNQEPFDVAVGVASGDAMIATVGTEERAETVVVGEPVVLARLIEEEAKAARFGVLVTEATFRALPPELEGAATPPVLVKGIGFPLTLYRVRPRRG